MQYQQYNDLILIHAHAKLSEFSWYGGKMPEIDTQKYFDNGVKIDDAINKVIAEVYEWEHTGL